MDVVDGKVGFGGRENSLEEKGDRDKRKLGGTKLVVMWDKRPNQFGIWEERINFWAKKKSSLYNSKTSRVKSSITLITVRGRPGAGHGLWGFRTRTMYHGQGLLLVLLHSCFSKNISWMEFLSLQS